MLPFFIMIIKNMKKYFTFEITILDDKNMHRRFRVSNFQSTTKVRPFSTSMPIGLSGGWNQIQFNLADFTRRAYGTNYVETTRMQIHANCRIRRIYFADRLYTEDETPEEFKLFLPMERKKCVREEEKKSKKPDEENVVQIMKSMPTDEPPEFEADETETEKPEVEVDAKVSKISALMNADDSPAQVQEEMPQEEHKDVTDTETEDEEEGIDAPEDEQESIQIKEMIGTLEDATEESEFLTEEETEPDEPPSEEEG
ncbi:glutamic acid-rich protein-like isoform X2 [Cephus cinctus]|nr:glutamic acid-rich protein-like isoform X2 [Cephus cinctus]